MIKAIFKELFGLFVDDGHLALYALALIALVGVLIHIVGMPASWGGGVLLLGCLLILWSSIQRARSQ